MVIVWTSPGWSRPLITPRPPAMIAPAPSYQVSATISRAMGLGVEFFTLMTVWTRFLPGSALVTGCVKSIVASPLIGGTTFFPASTGVSCVD